jgi:hypothetical protein
VREAEPRRMTGSRHEQLQECKAKEERVATSLLIKFPV